MSGEEYAFQQITFWVSRGWTFEVYCVYLDQAGSQIRYVAGFQDGGSVTHTGESSDVLGATLAVLQAMNRSQNT